MNKKRFNLLLSGAKKDKIITSDSFNRADGAIGVTDGLGYSGIVADSGFAWGNTTLTWAIATNKASCSDVTGGSFGMVSVDAGRYNVIVDGDVYITGNGCGVVARYVDVNNFVRAVINYPNIVLTKVVGGSVTDLITAVAGYEDNAKIRLVANGNKFKLYYKGALVGTEQTIDDAALQTATKHGITLNDTTNRLDNFVIWNISSLGFLGL